MSTRVQLPVLGENVTEGKILLWHKKIGDSVRVGEPLVEVSANNVSAVITAPTAGRLLEISRHAGSAVAVGEVLAWISDHNDPILERPTEVNAERFDLNEQIKSEEPKQLDDAFAKRFYAVEQLHDQDSLPPIPPPPDPVVAAPSIPLPRSAASPTLMYEAPVPETMPSQITEPSHLAQQEFVEVLLPVLDESVSHAIVTHWLKSIGDEVEAGDPLLEVSTDKVDTEIPAPVSGMLHEIRVAENMTVALGAVLAVIAATEPAARASMETPSPIAMPVPTPTVEHFSPPPVQLLEPTPPEPLSATPVAEAAATVSMLMPESTPTSPPPQTTAPEDVEPSSPPEAEPAPAVTAPETAPLEAQVDEPENETNSSYIPPVVRKLAEAGEIDLSEIVGSGVGGRIRKRDVVDAIAVKRNGTAETPEAADVAVLQSCEADDAASPAGAEPIRSDLFSPLTQLSASIEIDLTELSRLLAKHEQMFTSREQVALGYRPFFVAAVAEALKVFPILNAAIDIENNVITHPTAVNIGIREVTDAATPIVANASDLNVTGIAKAIATAGQNAPTAAESPQATFSIIDFGADGTLANTPIITQPQVAALGVGVLTKRLVVLDDESGDQLAIRAMIYLSLSYDYRVVGNTEAGKFLNLVKSRLEKAAFITEMGL
ncbi:MAG: 2-oxo acid dehydrogenase subunit E2 [Propionibacteriaceae bacterium]|nr:2-oxo acid dehydrogenase subunit E2 [Propionibacteriaceae bacterium]